MAKRVSAVFLLTAIVDGENVQLYRIVSDNDSLSVDANNVSERVECRLELQDGATSVPVTAFWSVDVKAREEVLDTYQFSEARQSIDYALPNGPFDQYGKFGRATHLIVIAYSDATREVELARKAFPLNREHPQYFPRTEPWSNTLTYRNGEYLLCSSYEEMDGVLLEGNQAVYVWNNPVPGNSAISPGEDVVKHPRTTCWQKHSKWPILMTEAFMANFAKLGSAVFSGDYMFSQHGKDESGKDTVDYRNPRFTPNFKVDWLKGKVTGLDMNIKGGRIGDFEVRNQCNLHNADGRDCWISIEHTEENGSRRMASLGNNVPGVAGFGVAGGFEATGAEENIALSLLAKGARLNYPFEAVGCKHNIALLAYGGVKWDREKDDYWSMPGLLGIVRFTCKLEGNTFVWSVANKWGDGIPPVNTGETSLNLNHVLVDLRFAKKKTGFYSVIGQSVGHGWTRNGYVNWNLNVVIESQDQTGVVFSCWCEQDKYVPGQVDLYFFGNPG